MEACTTLSHDMAPRSVYTVHRCVSLGLVDTLRAVVKVCRFTPFSKLLRMMCATNFRGCSVDAGHA